MNVCNVQRLCCFATCCGNNFRACGINNLVGDLVSILEVGNKRTNFYVSVVAINCWCNHNTTAAVVVKVEVSVVYCNQVNITVKSAVESEVCHLWVNNFVRGVVHYNCNFATFAKGIGQVNTPCGVTTVVMRFVFAIEVHVRRGVCATDFQIVAVCCGQIGLCNGLFVQATATEVVVATVVTVNSIPRVWKCYHLHVFVTLCICAILEKLPIVVERDDLSHLLPPKFSKFTTEYYTQCRAHCQYPFFQFVAKKVTKTHWFLQNLMPLGIVLCTNVCWHQKCTLFAFVIVAPLLTFSGVVAKIRYALNVL